MEDEEFVPPNQLNLHECKFCGRRFVSETFVKHQKICNKPKSRRVFDSGKQRAQGSDVPYSNTKVTNLIRKNPEDYKDPKIEKAKERKRNWRTKHEELVNNIRAARGAPPLPGSQSPNTYGVKQVPAGYISCEYCGRSFNESAAERHIPFCREQKMKNELRRKNEQMNSRNRSLINSSKSKSSSYTNATNNHVNSNNNNSNMSRHMPKQRQYVSNNSRGQHDDAVGNYGDEERNVKGRKPSVRKTNVKSTMSNKDRLNGVNRFNMEDERAIDMGRKPVQFNNQSSKYDNNSSLPILMRRKNKVIPIKKKWAEPVTKPKTKAPPKTVRLVDKSPLDVARKTIYRTFNSKTSISPIIKGPNNTNSNELSLLDYPNDNCESMKKNFDKIVKETRFLNDSLTINDSFKCYTSFDKSSDYDKNDGTLSISDMDEILTDTNNDHYLSSNGGHGSPKRVTPNRNSTTRIKKSPSTQYDKMTKAPTAQEMMMRAQHQKQKQTEANIVANEQRLSARFCSDCGGRFPSEVAKFCMMCGKRRNT
ncbi:hypothetical protein SNEBB_000860 [Seison nebaliae]|nr:hypothetical protein SNEBB_000860 [Seison nebaliae]